MIAFHNRQIILRRCFLRIHDRKELIFPKLAFNMMLSDSNVTWVRNLGIQALIVFMFGVTVHRIQLKNLFTVRGFLKPPMKPQTQWAILKPSCIIYLLPQTEYIKREVSLHCVFSFLFCSLYINLILCILVWSSNPFKLSLHQFVLTSLRTYFL